MNIFELYDLLAIDSYNLDLTNKQHVIKLEKIINAEIRLNSDIDKDSSSQLIKTLKDYPQEFKWFKRNKIFSYSNFQSQDYYNLSTVERAWDVELDNEGFIQKYLQEGIPDAYRKFLAQNNFVCTNILMSYNDLFDEQIMGRLKSMTKDKVNLCLNLLQSQQPVFSKLQFLKDDQFYELLNYFNQTDLEDDLMDLYRALTNRFQANPHNEFYIKLLVYFSYYEASNSNFDEVVKSNASIFPNYYKDDKNRWKEKKQSDQKRYGGNTQGHDYSKAVRATQGYSDRRKAAGEETSPWLYVLVLFSIVMVAAFIISNVTSGAYESKPITDYHEEYANDYITQSYKDDRTRWINFLTKYDSVNEESIRLFEVDDSSPKVYETSALVGSDSRFPKVWFVNNSYTEVVLLEMFSIPSINNFQFSNSRYCAVGDSVQVYPTDAFSYSLYIGNNLAQFETYDDDNLINDYSGSPEERFLDLHPFAIKTIMLSFQFKNDIEFQNKGLNLVLISPEMKVWKSSKEYVIWDEFSI